MYLKSIEIRGFKSFADRTLLHFNNGITGVVGPNGSGKSNISDAVRWVLGEQKVKSLRGGKMEDVIFSGTDFRKPLGYAEVTLLLDNSEKKLPVPYADVSVTRKLFRSGESEYLINNTTCRLRDIQELFMDTGIGKEGYSLIGQGKIEAILSGKMDDRRALLEEAAGIVKYKSRKEESERKLEHTEQNLVRVKDILDTYEERIGPLKREKEKAEKFLILSREQREISISLILSDLEEFDAEKASLERKLVEAQAGYNEVEKKRTEANEESERLELAIEEKKAQETEIREAYYLKRERSESLMQSVRMDTQLMEERKRSLERNGNAIKTNEERLLEEERNRAELLKEITASEKKVQEVTACLDGKRQEQKTLQESLRVSEDTQKGLREEEEDTDLKIRKLRDDARAGYSERDTLKGRIENIASMLKGYEASSGMNDMAEKDTSREIGILKEKMKAEEASHSARSTSLEEAGIELRKMEAEIKETDYELKGQESSLKMLKNLEAQYEGYTRSVKSLMNQLKASKHRMDGKVALVGEVIHPKKGFEMALEVAISAQVSHIITPTDRDAKELIELLRKKSFGRATFYPLNVIKGYKAKSPDLKRGKLLGCLYDLVEFDKKYENIAASLLGRIFVAENMDEALTAAKEMGYTMRIVTLAGDIINAGGSLTGGSIYNKSSGIFSRRKELEDLLLSTEALKKKRLQQSEEKAAVESELQIRMKAKRESAYAMSEIGMEMVRLTERHEAFLKDIKRLERITQETKKDLSSREAEMEDLDRQIEAHERKITLLLEQKEKNRDYLKGVKDRRTKDYREFDALTEFIMKESIAEGRLLEALAARQLTLEKTDAGIAERLNMGAELMKEKDMLYLEITGIREGTARKEEEAAQLKEEIMVMEERLDEVAMQEVQDKAAFKEKAALVRMLDEEFHVHDKALYKVKDALEKLEKEKNNLLHKINDEMDLTLAEAKEERIPMDDKDAFRKRLNELRRLITSLGSVNVAAIEEYREVKDHSEFLSQQRDDLDKAKEELRELILDMTIRMRTLFTENFKVMNENFNDTFRRLFQGGNARLILGEGDILEAPIEISVQPPGKKLQNITLMSGGEKVLSAIALTFAILRMKPTPFCILDEIEAALDDANVYRFAEFLTEFAQDTQFILITHRKGTMEAADALYGVTMEEKGISKIISMDLTEARRTNG